MTVDAVALVGDAEPLPKRTPGAHRVDALGQRSGYKFDPYRDLSPDTVRVGVAFVEGRKTKP